MNLHERRQAEFEKYRRVYRDYPRYRNRENRIELTREWIENTGKAERMERILDGPTLLDVGCGRGEVVNMARDQLGVHADGCEVVPELWGFIDHINPIKGAHDLPYATASYDLVTCTDVLEHILEEDVPAALAELARVARGPVLLVICHEPDRPGKYGEKQLHVTVKGRPWWEFQIRKNMDPVSMRVLYADRVNERGSWIEVQCG